MGGSGSGTQYFSNMVFSTYMSGIVVTFTASAPTHFADMTTNAVDTEEFDVYLLMYQRTLTLDTHNHVFNNKEDRVPGTLQMAKP